MSNWKNTIETKPPINELVELKHMITGAGSPERKGWEATGRMRKNGRFTVMQNDSNTVDLRLPTHWRAIKCKHKKAKRGYVEGSEYADKQHEKGIEQIRCSKCKLWIWPDEF